MTADAVPVEPDPLEKEILAAVPETRQTLVERYLAERVATLIGEEPSRIDVEASLADLAISSTALNQLMGRFEEVFQVWIYAPQIFDAPSLAAVAEYLTELINEEHS